MIALLRRLPRAFRAVPLAAACVLVALHGMGCGGRPDRVNIQLRKQIQDLEQQIEQLNSRHAADVARIRSLEDQRAGGTLPTLPQERLDQLVTAHGIHIGRLTAGANTDADRAGDEAVKVYVVPMDHAGDPIKATGSFVVEVFDLSLGEDNRIGRWEFSPDEALENWYGNLFNYTYAFTLPWQRPPKARQITVRVSFLDLLTGREFVEQKTVEVMPPEPTESTQPTRSTAPAPPVAGDSR